VPILYASRFIVVCLLSFAFSLCETADAEDLFGDADDISSVSSHGEGDRADADVVCSWAF